MQRGMGFFRTKCWERQERGPDGHENEWKSATGGNEGHLEGTPEAWDREGFQESM